MIKLRVFKKGPTYHRHTQKKTWAVVFLPVSRFLLLCPTQNPPKKNETPSPTLDLVFIDTDLGTVEICPNFQHSNQPRRNVPKEGLQPRSRLKVVLFEQHVGLAGESQMSQQEFLSYIRPRNRLDTPPPKKKKKQEVMGVC